MPCSHSLYKDGIFAPFGHMSRGHCFGQRDRLLDAPRPTRKPETPPRLEGMDESLTDSDSETAQRAMPAGLGTGQLDIASLAAEKGRRYPADPPSDEVGVACSARRQPARSCI